MFRKNENFTTNLELPDSWMWKKHCGFRDFPNGVQVRVEESVERSVFFTLRSVNFTLGILRIQPFSFVVLYFLIFFEKTKFCRFENMNLFYTELYLQK